MKIELREVKTPAEFKQFVKFPIALYKNNSYYVPPIINDELETLNRNKNPVFSYAKAWFYLAYKNEKVVGRIAAIINNLEVDKLQKRKMRFGWFDVVDDIEVTKALLNKVAEIGKQHQLEYIEGPVGFSNLDKAGMLVEGFNELSTMITIYNHKYYSEHLEQLGYEKASDWIESRIKAPTELPQKVKDFSKLIVDRYKVKLISFNNKEEMKPYVKPMFQLLEESYSSLESYVPISKEQIDYYAEKYIKILNPKFINCVEDENGDLIAFAIIMPSYAKAMQKAKGKLFPIGWYYLLQASKKIEDIEFLLIGVHPNYQRKGVTALIFFDMFYKFIANNIKYIETNPQLDENKSIQQLFKDYNPHQHKRRRTYKKMLE